MAKSSSLYRVYRLKVILSAISLLFLGCALAWVSDAIDIHNGPHLVQVLLSALSDAAIVTGAIGIGVDYFVGRDREHAEVERARSVLKELTPDFTDAVVRGFSVSPDDLKRVASPELLDEIVSNVLGLRLGDQQFASEVYADLRDQAVRAPERWHDVQVRVRLSTAVERSATGAPLFDVVVEWEYTVVPTHVVQRFACVSDRDEFHQLVSEVPATLPWFMTRRDGLEARDRANYELLAFSVDGAERRIKRSERATGQTYSATIGEDVVRAGKPVRIRQLYRTVTPQSGHRLYFEAVQPSRQFSLEVDYTDTDIAYMSVTELVSSSHRSRVSVMPKQVDARVMGIDLPGWLLPKSGFAFVWTLASEQTAAKPGRAAASARSKTA